MSRGEGITTRQLEAAIMECTDGVTTGYVCRDWKHVEYCLHLVQNMTQTEGNWLRKTIKIGQGTIRFISVRVEPHTLVGYRAKYVFDHATFIDDHWRDWHKEHDWRHFAEHMNTWYEEKHDTQHRNN